MTSVVRLDVLIIGAGLSGIGAAYRIQTEHPERSYAVLEARSDLGGTWDLFRFPGVRSDSDMFTLGYPFHPWTDERSIADGASILAYIRETAQTYDIDAKINYDHRVVSAAWSSEEARWTVEALHKEERLTYSCAFLFLCTGYYRYDAGHEVSFPGLEDFGGQVVHPQHWPADLDTAGKNVVVVGSGATAVTLVPALAAGGAQVTWLQRSPSYLVSVRTRSKAVARLRRWLPPRIASRVARTRSVVLGSLAYAWMRRWPRKGSAFLTEGVQRRLPDDVPLDPHFIPGYDPWDQRLCVITDGDLFKAIRNRTAEVITDEIETLTAGGLRLRSGRDLSVDVLVTATGLSVVAFGQIAVFVDGRSIDAAESLVYKGMMFDGVPNLAWAVGYPNASWTLRSDLTARYVCRLLRHLDRTRTTTVTPVRPAGLEPRPLFGFTSGYIQRAAGVMPRQGNRAPWRVWTSYPVDLLALRLGRVSDGSVRFSRPGRTAARRERVGV